MLQTRFKTNAVFFDKLKKNIEDCVVNEELRIILGGDFNVALDYDLDCSHEQIRKDSVTHIQDLYLDIDLVDIWFDLVHTKSGL